MPLIRYSSSVRRTFPPHARPAVLSWRASSFLSFVINLHIIINSQRIDECAWFSPGITPQIKEISTDGFFCFLRSVEWVAGEICHVICHKAESKKAGKYANASDRLSLPRDERSVRYFIFLLSFPIFYQFITRFWSGPWALCFGRIHHSSICWPVPMTFLYYIVIRLVIFNFFHHLWLLLSAFSTFVLRRSSIQRDLLAPGMCSAVDIN